MRSTWWERSSRRRCPCRAWEPGWPAGGDDANAIDSEQRILDQAVASLLGSGEQIFVALLRPMNVNANGGPVRGVAVVKIDGDTVDVITVARGLTPGIEHMQHIHGFPSGAFAACPSSTNDKDGNGVVDVVEGAAAYGDILVPLDSDLNDLGAQTYPTASADGVIRYEMKGSLAAIGTALGDPESRIIAVHGVAPDAQLPPGTQTVAALGPATMTLPVACGELVRVR